MSSDEDRRIEALYGLDLLDSLPEARFDRITRLACAVAKVPIALISFVDRDRQWFKSRRGFEPTETPREISFCTHTILHEASLVVPDTREDPRFAENPLVVGSPHCRFYAGHPIHAPGGIRVGTLCVLDIQPRNLSAQDLCALEDLAALVDAELLAQKFNNATRAVGVGVHDRFAGNRDMWWSDAMWDIFGQDPCTFHPSADNWLALVHPEDQQYVREHGGAWGRPRTSLGLQYRIVRPDGTIRYLQSIASTTACRNGRQDCIAGITLDVTERVCAEQLEYGNQQKLRESSHQAGMAEIASGVLHSVGNVVNSLGIANATIRRDLKTLRLEQLEQATALIRTNRAHLACFLGEDVRGRNLPDYLPALSTHIVSKVASVQSELDAVDSLLEHLRDIVSAQQLRAHVGGQRELVDLEELLDATLAGQMLELSHIQVVRDYEDLPLVTTDRHKLLLILMNLLNNARDAVLEGTAQPGRVVIRLSAEADEAVIRIEDSGVGMSPEVLSHLWRFGFTTKPKGNGFDLHNSANAAREIGATLAAQSEGLNKGSRFILRLPIRSHVTATPAIVV